MRQPLMTRNHHLKNVTIDDVAFDEIRLARLSEQRERPLDRHLEIQKSRFCIKLTLTQYLMCGEGTASNSFNSASVIIPAVTR